MNINTATYGDVIYAYDEKNIIGYKFDKSEGDPLIVSEKLEENVIRVYYVKDKIEYTVEYYYEGELDENKCVCRTNNFFVDQFWN